MLSDAQIDRYSRQIILPEIGARGQARLLSATAALRTAQPLSSFLLRYLLGAGIGRLTMWTTAASADAREWIDDTARLNPDCQVDLQARESADDWLADTRPTVVIVAGASVSETAAVNSACVQAGTPLIWGHAVGTRATLAVFDPTHASGCYACFGRATIAAPTESLELQSLGASILASLQAAEAIKIALGQRSPLAGGGLVIDTGTSSVTPLSFEQRAACAICSEGARR